MKKARSLLTSTLVILVSLASGVIASDFAPMGDETSIGDQPATAREGSPADAADHQSVSKAAPARSAAAILAALDEAGRNNSVIELEASGPATASWPLPDATEVAALWNEGHFDQALRTLEQLEATGLHFVPAISWREPIVSSQRKYYVDKRIGDARTGADDFDLAYHGGEATVFAAVSWPDGWSMNISTDGGANWAETFFYPGQSKISMTVCGDKVWVAYSANVTNTTAKMRRFEPDDGAVDSAYFWEQIADIAPAVVDDIALIGNEPDVATAVYIGLIDGDDNLRTYWDDLDGTSFSDYSPAVTNADRNLDFTWCPYGFSTSGYVAYLSFETNTQGLEVWRMSFLGTWDQVLTDSLTGAHHFTAISAYGETVMTAFEGDRTNGNGIEYRVSYDHGDLWYSGSVYVPDAGGPEAFGADVSLRFGQSANITYHLEEGVMDNVYHISREGLGNGTWGAPFDFANHDSMSGTRTEVEFIGARCVGSYGMLYLAADGIPYFDLMNPRGFFCDGFESGNVSAWN